MPTAIHSKRDSSSSAVDLQGVLVCLGLVFAFILTSFGLAKLIEAIRTRMKIMDTEARSITEQSSSLEIPVNLPVTPNAVDLLIHAVRSSRLSALRRKPRPLDLRTGAIKFCSAAPCLQHISSPRSYALRHPRRPCFTRPGPTPLRTVLTATKGKLASSNVAVAVQHRLIISEAEAAAACLSLQRTHRTHSPLEHPAPIPNPSHNSNSAYTPIQIPVSLAPARDRTSCSPLSLELANMCSMHSTANAVVGAHPDALPLHHRALPLPLHHRPAPYTPRESPSAPPSPVKALLRYSKTFGKLPRPLSDSYSGTGKENTGGADAKVNIIVDGGANKRSSFASNTAMYESGGRNSQEKENLIAPVYVAAGNSDSVNAYLQHWHANRDDAQEVAAVGARDAGSADEEAVALGVNVKRLPGQSGAGSEGAGEGEDEEDGGVEVH
ncbi:hypothetical protein K438DRAFT_2019008 [Mycena galopus ATCC 62051]|nr:hypothetical protein K438DRAFT_2019008 [Mycena galopus ATCC 62051]